MNYSIVQFLNNMISEQNILVTTPKINTDDINKNYFLLGEWCKNLDDNLQPKKNLNVMRHHWTSSEKLFEDYKYINDLYEKLLNILSIKLNKYHKTTFSLKEWRIVIGPWLSVYLSSMYDKWESLRIFFEKQNTNLITYDFEYSNDILIN